MVTAAAQTGVIVGTWRGTSTCVDREHFPACKDERVIYETRLVHSSPDTVILRADKLVDGSREFMGEYALTPQPDSSWAAPFRTPRVHLLLRLQVRGDHMTGTLTDVPTGHRVRDIALERTQ